MREMMETTKKRFLRTNSYRLPKMKMLECVEGELMGVGAVAWSGGRLFYVRCEPLHVAEN